MSATPLPVAFRKASLAPQPLFDSPDAADAAVTGYLDHIAPAYSSHTLRGLRSDWQRYRDWCHQEGVSALPATPEAVSAYIAALRSDHCPGTIRHHLATLSHLHRA